MHVTRERVQHTVVDHTIHGLVTIRLVDAPQHVAKALVRTLGRSHGSASAEPDITIRFVDTLPIKGRLRFLGLNEAAFDDDYFYVLDDLGYRVRVDFDRLGEPCELVCERGIKSIPLILPILGLRFLRKRHILLHSGSFVYAGKGILVAGWQKGGKTELSLPYIAAGAEYMSDEWTVVSAETGTLYGLTGIAQIWSWHFRYMPQFWARVSKTDRLRILLMRLYQRLYRQCYSLLPKALRERSLLLSYLYRFSLEGGFFVLGQVRSAPEILFDNQVRRAPAQLDYVFLATVGEGQTTVLPIEPQEIADRMVASQAFERRKLLIAYAQFRFAFPDRANTWLENASEHERSLLAQALANKPAYEVCHPYPMPLNELYSATRPLIGHQDPTGGG
jgi:hypothetical protein